LGDHRSVKRGLYWSFQANVGGGNDKTSRGHNARGNTIVERAKDRAKYHDWNATGWRHSRTRNQSTETLQGGRGEG